MRDWTDQDGHDPGVTLLQLLAWLAVGLLVAAGVAAYRRRRRRCGC